MPSICFRKDGCSHHAQTSSSIPNRCTFNSGMIYKLRYCIQLLEVSLGTGWDSSANCKTLKDICMTGAKGFGIHYTSLTAYLDRLPIFAFGQNPNRESVGGSVCIGLTLGPYSGPYPRCRRVLVGDPKSKPVFVTKSLVIRAENFNTNSGQSQLYRELSLTQTSGTRILMSKPGSMYRLGGLLSAYFQYMHHR